MAEKMKDEDYLEKYGTLTYTNVGVSMMPLLRQGKDLFTITKKDKRRFRRGGVALFSRHTLVVLQPFIDTGDILSENRIVLGVNIGELFVVPVGLLGVLAYGAIVKVGSALYLILAQTLLIHFLDNHLFFFFFHLSATSF